ncbi:NAD(P)H dehydrogenase (quinone) [Sarracenia purpurea var. burkii]
MEASSKNGEILETSSTAESAEADGLLSRFSMRCECVRAQMKLLFDPTGKLRKRWRLAAKPAGIFASTSPQGGDQETAASEQDVRWRTNLDDLASTAQHDSTSIAELPKKSRPTS